MARKISAIVLAIIMLAIQPIHVFALELVSTEPTIIDREKHEKIAELMDLRCVLCVDSETNKEHILKIDKELKELGVEEIFADEMAKKLGYPENSIMATPAARTGVTFLSERFVTVWYGERYEVQVVTSSPTVGATSSPLKEKAVIYFESSQKQRADEICFLGVVAQGAYDVVSNFVTTKYSTYISCAMTFFDVFSGATTALEKSTYVSGIDTSTTVNISFYERHVFIKPEGSSDVGNQILAYCGNKVIYTATVVSPGDILIDGESYPVNDVATITEEYRAQYYDNYTQRVARVFWEYRNNGVTDFKQYYWTGKITFEGIGDKERTISVPYVSAAWS